VSKNINLLKESTGYEDTEEGVTLVETEKKMMQWMMSGTPETRQAAREWLNKNSQWFMNNPITPEEAENGLSMNSLVSISKDVENPERANWAAEQLQTNYGISIPKVSAKSEFIVYNKRSYTDREMSKKIEQTETELTEIKESKKAKAIKPEQLTELDEREIEVQARLDSMLDARDKYRQNKQKTTDKKKKYEVDTILMINGRKVKIVDENGNFEYID